MLFIGLASLACRSRSDAVRALAAAALTAGWAFALPGLRALALLPRPGGRFAAVLARVPAPILGSCCSDANDS